MFYHIQVDGEGKKRAALYARSSANTRTTDTQLGTCRAVADQLGLDVIGEFVDENVSGAVSLGLRPGGQELLGQLSSIDVLLVYRLDRIARIAQDLECVIAVLDESAIELWSVADLAFPARILGPQVPQIAQFAEAERAAIRHRMGAGLRRRAETGRWLSGPVPFGYDLDGDGRLTPSLRPVAGITESELARSVFEQMAAGSSTIKEARRLNELNVFPGRRYSHKSITMRRGNWLPSRVNAMIRNTTYKGVHVYEAAEGRIERQVVALVSPSLWQSAQDTIVRNRSGANRSRREYLLRGLIFCGDCGCGFAGTTSGWANKRIPFYRCAGQVGVMEPDPEMRCVAKAIRAIAIERLIWAECAEFAGERKDARDFVTRRQVVEENVRSLFVTTTGKRPKIAVVEVDFFDGRQCRFVFKGEDGQKL